MNVQTFNFNQRNLYKLLFGFLSLAIIYFFVDIKKIFQSLSNINIKFVLLCILISIPLPFALAIRWYFIIENITKVDIPKFLKQYSYGVLLSELFSNPLMSDVAKFYFLNDKKKTFKLELLFIEKIYAISIKILFLIFFFNLVNFLFLKKFVLLFLIISVLFFFLPFLLIKIFNKINTKLTLVNNIKKKFKFFFSNNNIKRRKVLLTELFRNFIIHLIYLIIFINFFSLEKSMILVFVSIIIETSLRFLYFNFLGAREILFLISSNFYSSPNEVIVLSSAIFSSIMLLANINFYFLSQSQNFNNFFLKKL